MIIIVLIVVFTIVYFYYTETFVNYKKLSCNKNIIVKDSLKQHIIYTNKLNLNKNILQPNGILPYNLNNTEKYNILNNFGIKNQKKRNNYIKSLSNCNVIPQNSFKLLKNYDNILDTSFINISINKWNDEKCNKLSKIDYPNISLVSNDYSIHWSYYNKYLNNKFFYVYYKYIDKCEESDDFNKNYNSLKLKDNFDCNEFNFIVSTYKERNIYKLIYKLSTKSVKIYIVLKEDNNYLKKSNIIKLLHI